MDAKRTTQKKLYGPYLWMGFYCLNATTTTRRQFIFSPLAPRKSWYSFDRPQKDERLSQPWSHQMVLNLGKILFAENVSCQAQEFLSFINTARQIYNLIHFHKKPKDINKNIKKNLINLQA